MAQLTKCLVISRRTGEITSREAIEFSEEKYFELSKQIHTYVVNRICDEIKSDMKGA